MGITMCEWNGCSKTKETGATGEMQVSIIDPNTHKKITRVLCNEHRAEWLRMIWEIYTENFIRK